jgi:hypothetical protein
MNQVSDWTGTHRMTLIVPSDYSGNEVDIPVGRKSKRSTALVAVKAYCDVSKPLIVVRRKTVEEEFCAIG